ncbi:hypothetical protein EJ03DRAFT_11391 [Teratosphaeria nubilosa]|uniref:Atos-like conserved domain-containing protein n=1 Tax=Teratosphaeria nubilosa TaxID=161662 RepID=A0A6G1LGE3_9PEZI|nr:hypothetical protein EJ03DRAFT_11391 [Teratosphaeria nubilosa]
MAIYNEPYDASMAERAKTDEEENGTDGRRASLEDRPGSTSPTAIYNPYYTGRPKTPAGEARAGPINRQELIRRIKSRDSRPTSPELELPPSVHGRHAYSPLPYATSTLPPDSRPQSPEAHNDNASIGTQIERPRSALHRGDFREKEHAESGFGRFVDGSREEQVPALSTSPAAPWHPDFPRAVFRQAREEWRRQPSPDRLGVAIPQPQRARAASNASLAASFAYKPPTSPLVQSSRPDTPEPEQRGKSRSPDKSRRHTFSPQSFLRAQSGLGYPASARDYRYRQPPALRQERSFPCQAHQPRRSLNTFQSLPHSPLPRSRRPSMNESPLHRAPMVGSYEESILRGRMSTTPSKPLNFVAQIGVLGKGDCKPNLRCPPHVTIPFPAVFYSNPSSMTTEQPSPYVGLIDVEHNLPNQEAATEKRRHRLHAALSDEGSRASSRTRDDGSGSDAQVRRRRRQKQKQKQKRRSGSPRAPSGGSYRIPQQGQLQIVLKNPNKTAVKLFLVPYDLSDMGAGQKTFIRQRSYSAGPVIDMPLTSRRNFGTDRPEAALSGSDDPNDRPMLRYLIHLHICCPSKGRYFLYKSVRVVFANRVPDGKEKLRNEIQMPEPRYSVYKAGRDSNVGVASAQASRDVIARKSNIDTSSLGDWDHRRYLARSLPSAAYEQNADISLPMQPLPFHVSRQMSPLESRPSSRQLSNATSIMDIDSQRSDETVSPRSALASPTVPRHGDAFGEGKGWRRLEDPFNFGRDTSRERQVSGTGNESLLSRRLRDLAVQAQRRSGNENGEGT